MYQHLLIATDGSDLAQKAVDHGLALAKALKAKATIVTVTEPWAAMAPGEVAIAVPQEEYDKSAAVNAARILSAASETAAKIGAACDTLHVKDHSPAEGIVEAAKWRSCDLIVMASHGRRGLARLLLGSQTMKVVTHSTIPVLVCR